MKLSSYSVTSINLRHLPIVSVYGSAKFGDGKWFSFIYNYLTTAGCSRPNSTYRCY